MVFTSLKYIAFFAVVTAGWYLLPDKLRKPWLLLSNYFFYMYAFPAFGLLLFIITAITYLCALFNERTVFKCKNFFAVFGIVFSVSILAFYKYLKPFITFINGFFGHSVFSFKYAVPIGISFITFAVMGYLFDVINGKINAEKSFIDYAAFVSFFPCILSGPIGQASLFMPQLKELAPYSGERIRRGMMRFLCGAVRKMVIADTLGGIVDAVYAAPWEYSGGATLLVIVLYALQIYFDFSGYSDMAIGCADALGFKVLENFRAPYLSVSVKDFWKKWHISLTGWFRTYLYFPLGGNRKGRVRTLFNILVVYAVSGLWHGSSLTFLIWGLLNGFYQLIEILADKRLKKLNSRPWRLFRGFITFSLVAVAFVFFRSESVSKAMYIIKHSILILRDGFGISSVLSVAPVFMTAVVVFLSIPFIIEDIRIAMNKTPLLFENKPVLYWTAVLLFVLTISIFGVYGEGFDPKEFVYFNF